MAPGHPGGQSPDSPAEPEPRLDVSEETEPGRPATRPVAPRLVSPSAHRWPVQVDDESVASPPAGATRPAAGPEPVAELEPAAKPESAAESESAADSEPGPVAEFEPAPDPQPEPGPGGQMEPEWAVGPERSPAGGARRALLRPLRILLALVILSALLVAPQVLSRASSMPAPLPLPRATQGALAHHEDVAAMPPPGRAAVVASPTSSSRPRPTTTPTSTPGSGSTPTPGGVTSPAPTSAPTSPVPPPTSAPPPSSNPVGTCGAPQNPWGYNFCGGNLVTSPPQAFCSVFNCVPHFWDQAKVDYVAECNDGTYAENRHGPASCGSHGGEMRPLYGP